MAEATHKGEAPLQQPLIERAGAGAQPVPGSTIALAIHLEVRPPRMAAPGDTRTPPPRQARGFAAPSCAPSAWRVGWPTAPDLAAP